MLTRKNIEIEEIIPFDLQRKVVSHITSSSWKNIPLVSYIYEPDITDFYSKFKNLADRSARSTDRPCKITLNTLLLKVIVEGLQAAPKLNSLLEYNPRTVNGRLLVCADINISLPWLMADWRMITPIIEKANKKSLFELSSAVASLEEKIDNTNINEMLYQSARADTIGELKNQSVHFLADTFLDFRPSEDRPSARCGKTALLQYTGRAAPDREKYHGWHGNNIKHWFALPRTARLFWSA